MNEQHLPILVACGQITDRSADGSGMTPVQLMAAACRQAGSDSGSEQLLQQVDSIACSGLTVDAEQVSTPLSGSYSNVPKTVANLLGIKPNNYYYAATGGNTPQMLVNHFAGEIAAGRSATVLLTGGEALRTMTRRFDHWYKLLRPKGVWRNKPGGTPTPIGDRRSGVSKHEELYGLDLPAISYPLFENALAAHYRRGKAEHLYAIGELFAGFTKVAVQNPYAWFQKQHSPDELITSSASNRMIAYPYTKLLNSMIYVNQAAALVLTSVATAKSLNIDPDKWIYLHGCADIHEKWNISERANYHSSPALGKGAAAALSMAGKNIDDMACFDIYSCFPAAVQIACDEFGIKHDDPRGLTLTGGLPYFGGPGNNYSMHAIAAMMQKLREHPREFGMLNANGWHLTKHSIGIYSNVAIKTAPDKTWAKPDLRAQQQQLMNADSPAFTTTPKGAAIIETYTVVFDRKNQPERGIVIGRLKSGERFLAQTPDDAKILNYLLTEEVIGYPGRVSLRKKLNVFELD